MIQQLQHRAGSTRIHVNDRGDHIQKWWCRGQWYESTMLDAMAAVSAGGTFIDIGAHQGNHTLYMARVVGVQTVAIEPDPINAKWLVMNTALNALHEKVRVARYGVSDVPQTRYAKRTPRNSGMTELVADHTGGQAIICLPLPTILEQVGVDGPIDIIKVDAERMEKEVLAGALPVIAAHRPHLFVETEQPFLLVEQLPGYRVGHRYNRTATYHLVPENTNGCHQGTT